MNHVPPPPPAGNGERPPDAERARTPPRLQRAGPGPVGCLYAAVAVFVVLLIGMLVLVFQRMP